ncbi:MAG: hypothetical protein M3472_08095 [Chloroflexota bacterium]|nr:hypothetical protein [Chloroflexota bacterium]
MLSVRAGTLSLVVACLIAGCAPASSGQQGGQPATPRITPQASLSTQVATGVAVVREALAAQGIRLDPPIVPYRAAEPPGIAAAPRAVLQAGIGDPEGGYVMVYEFPDANTASARGTEFAEYLASGFGQTNYPLDAQFYLTQVGGTLIFTWWSSELAADRELARTAFEAISSVGAPIPVVK